MLPDSWSPIKKIGVSINYGIEILTTYEEEIKEKSMEDFSEYINEAVDHLSQKEIEEILEYLTKTKESYVTIINDFANIGMGMKKVVHNVDGEKREAYIDAKSPVDKTIEEKLASSILSFKNTRNAIMTIHYAIEVIDISIDLISKYLPSQQAPSEDEKKLHRVTENIGE